MADGYKKGFNDQPNEIIIDSLEVEGKIPTWLSGTLLRNGPAQFQLEGLAMLHKFDIDGAKSRVGYANKYLDTPAFQASKEGVMRYSEFATDPCRSLFKRITHVFTGSTFGANANVSIGKMAEEFVAQTEIPMPVAFDPRTLTTIGIMQYEDQLKGDVTTAHPHYDHERHEAYNYLLKFGQKSAYNVYGLPEGSKTRQLLGSPTSDKPSYMHSFGLSENYAILMEFPFVVNPLAMLISGKPFIANYQWKPERGTRFSLVNRKTGVVSYTHTNEAWFGFHHVNAVDHDGKIDLDIIAYPNADVVQHFYLNSLLQRPNHNVYPKSELRRFTLDLATNSVESKTLADYSAELPRINYEHYNTKPYRYVYACGIAEKGTSVFLDTIVKFDIETGTTKEWKKDDHYPGEPVYVAHPDAKNEDDGLLLTVVLDAKNDTSYLLILDARDLSEVAKARVPQHIPFGFHGMYTRSI